VGNPSLGMIVPILSVHLICLWQFVFEDFVKWPVALIVVCIFPLNVANAIPQSALLFAQMSQWRNREFGVAVKMKYFCQIFRPNFYYIFKAKFLFKK
jgi:hypothetical protein